jgi:nucleotide-binding universal stress UspA family protein
VEILPMLVRLEHALGCPELSKQLVLIPKPKSSALATDREKNSDREINLVVGYDGSPRSQTALDITLWIAHQTRLATGRSVTVQVVYVITASELNDEDVLDHSASDLSFPMRGVPLQPLHEVLDRAEQPNSDYASVEYAGLRHTACGVSELIRPEPTTFGVANQQQQQFENADRILWQARHLADEWRGSLKTHLRFGTVAEELCQVAIEESATVLLIGCESADHPMVRALATAPCPVLGIPVAACRR